MTKKFLLYLAIPLFLVGAIVKGYKHYEKFYYKPDLTVIGFVEMWDGLGRQSAEIIEALTKDCSIRFWPTRKSHTDKLPKAVRTVIKKRRAQLGKVVIYEDIFYPSSHNYFSRKFTPKTNGSVKIAYTMFESTKIPDYWVENLNTFFDAAVVPDPFYVKVYKDSGVKIPIFSIPLGLNLANFLNTPLKKSASSPFVFGCFSTCLLRKNHVDLVRAFHLAFEGNEEVKLVINCKSYQDDAYTKLQEEITKLQAKNIEVTTNCYNKHEYLNQFKNIDCYVNLSKSEGFSIQPREAMALGLPVIVSDNTAQTTICKSGLVESVSCPTTEPAYYEHFEDVYGVRFNIDVNDAATKMKEVYANYPKQIELAERRRLWAAKYDYSFLKRYYKTLVRPSKIFLSSENKIEGSLIYTNSPSLKEKYDNILYEKK